MKQPPPPPPPPPPTHTHILRNLDNFPSDTFYSTPPTIRHKRVCAFIYRESSELVDIRIRIQFIGM